jgi:rod shape-determining protein MreC
VAKVSEVRRDPGQPFAQVIAAPTARLDRSHQVLLVWTLSETGLGDAPGVVAADPANPTSQLPEVIE